MDLPSPPRSLLRAAGRAIGDYRMIRADDRVLVAVSGGKDSLSLLVTLLTLARRAPVRFEVGAVTIDPVVEGFDPSHLKAWYESLGIPYVYHRQHILDQAKERLRGDSFCAYCSRMKRGAMYDAARKQGYNVLALGQHLDDLAESFLLSAFHRGQLGTMKAHYVNDAGDLRVIRPFVYVRETQTRDFARAAALPVVPDSCPACFQMPTERMHMKELLAAESARNRQLHSKLLSAMRPLMAQGLPTE